MGKYLVAALFLFWVSSAFAMDGCGAGPCAKCHSLSLKEANELLREVGEVKKVEVSPVNGLWLLELEKARTILGAKSPELLDKAFAGEALPQPGARDSGRPVDETIRIAEAWGIDSTPSMILPDGSVLVGGRNAELLKGLLAAVKK